MSTTTATRTYKSIAQIRAERASLDMVLVGALVDRLFQAWQRHGLLAEAKAVRAEHDDDAVLRGWVDHYLNEKIAQVAPQCMGKVDGTVNPLTD